MNCLIWLDLSVNNSRENLDAQKRLQSLVNHLKTFEQIDQCEQYIQSTSPQDHLTLIVSGQFGEKIVPRIHQLQQISSIYIYCTNKKINEQWSNRFAKVKGVMIQLDELISQIQSNRTRKSSNMINEPLLISIFNPNSNHGQSTSEVNGQFLHSQLLIDALLRMKPTKTDKNELITVCRKEYEDNPLELKILDEFENEYVSNRSLWWYTRESFLYRLMNKALRVQNIDLLYLFRFFIRDIRNQLEEYRCSSLIRLYRGQLISNEELKILKNSIGQLISINSFLSTSINRQLALSFLQSSTSTDDLQRILFEIDADPRVNENKPFANITSFSYFPGEDEVLMMLGSIFRLVNLDYDKDEIWIIRMTLCGDDDHDMKFIFDYLRARLEKGETTLYSFGQVLRDMGQFDAAEKYIHRFLNGLPPGHRDVPICCHALGVIMDEKCDYHSSLQWHQKSLDMWMKILKSNHPDLADAHNCIAVVYRKLGQRQQALESYEKALKIFGDDHLKMAMCFNNIGVVYYEDKNYSKALEYYRKALTIWQKYLPANHSHLGAAYNNIGEVLRHLHQYDQALEQHRLSLNIYEKSLPGEHPVVATAFENIGLVYEEKGDLQQARSYLEKASIIFRHTLPPTNPDVIRIEQNIKRVSSKLK